MNELGTSGTELRWQHNVIQIRYWPVPDDTLEDDGKNIEPVVIGATDAAFAADGPDGHITFHAGKPAYRGRVEFIKDTNVETTSEQFRGVSVLRDGEFTKMEPPNLMCEQTEALSADPAIVAKCAAFNKQDAERERLQDAKMRAYAAQEHAKSSEKCLLPSPGWKCTRGAGHSGPCAALPEHGTAVSLMAIADDSRFTTLEGLEYTKSGVTNDAAYTMLCTPRSGPPSVWLGENSLVVPGWKSEGHSPDGGNLEAHQYTEPGPTYVDPDLDTKYATAYAAQFKESVPGGFSTRVTELVRERGSAYGTPSENHQLTADLWSLWLSRKLGRDVKFTAEDVCMFNLLQKQSRLAFVTKDDSWFDIAGYTENVAMLRSDQRNR